MINVDLEKKLRAYDSNEVLKVSHQFPDRSITKVYGPSGIGKTTLLKIIAGFIKPEKGIVTADGVTWFDASTKIFVSPQKRMIGFVFQDYALFPNMTVKQHLEYATSDQAWIEKLVDIGKLKPFVKHKPQHLSGGQQQRVAILRALAVRPKLLLMDEPFSALDLETKAELISELKLIFDELALTALIVSHNPLELEGLVTDELVINSEGINA